MHDGSTSGKRTLRGEKERRIECPTDDCNSTMGMGCPRRPLLPCENEIGERLWMHPDTQALVSLERELSGKAKVWGS